MRIKGQSRTNWQTGQNYRGLGPWLLYQQEKTGTDEFSNMMRQIWRKAGGKIVGLKCVD